MTREPAKAFVDLIVWQKAHAFTLQIYGITQKFSRHEMFGLTSQMRRAAVSIAANIAEGFKKKGKLDKVRFLNISQGSLEECRYYLLLANDLGYCQTGNFLSEAEEVSRLLGAYSAAISHSDS